jgi:rhomboid protease GluP
MTVGFPPKHSEVITHSNISKEQFMALAMEAIKTLEWTASGVRQNRIIAYKYMSLSSWGEEITIEVEERLATIESKSTGSQLIDWGKNQKNVEEFVDTYTILAKTVPAKSLTKKVKEMQAALPSDVDNASNLTEEDKSSGFLSLFLFHKGYVITPILSYLNILVFIVMAIMGVDLFLPTAESVLKFGANFRPLTLDGEWWRLLTSCFVHFGIFHLLMNLYALLYIGMLLEPLLGSTRFSIAYILTGLTGSITSLYWHEMTVSTGASGAIFGMYGVFLALLTTKFIEEAKRKALLTSIGIFVVYNLMNGLEGNIDNAAHIGGLLGGLFIGYCYYLSLKKPEDSRLKTATISFSIIILVSTTYFVYANTSNDLGLYQKNMEIFGSLETQAIKAIQFSHEPPVDSALVAVKEGGIKKWQEAIILLDKTDRLKLPDVLHQRNEILKRCCDLRIRSYAFLCRVIERKADVNSMEFEMIKSQLTQVMGELKTNTGKH